jgi:hypothetical protein
MSVYVFVIYLSNNFYVHAVYRESHGRHFVISFFMKNMFNLLKPTFYMMQQQV